ncbi:MAG: ATPase, partial [Nanoarchaeota archaeon]
MKETKDIKLKVMEALQEEAYKGIVRIDSETMHLIGVHPGDVIQITGGRETVGIVDRAYPTDVGQNVIRMDGILRRNAKTSIGEFVKIIKADIKEAKDIVIAPAQKGVMVKADPRIFKRALLGRAVVKGDIVAPGGTKTRHRTMSDSPFFEEVFSMFEESFTAGFGLSGLRFIVVNTNPKNAVIITENTELTLNPKAVEISDERIPEVSYEDIGGLKEEISKIREMVELPLKHPDL